MPTADYELEPVDRGNPKANEDREEDGERGGDVSVPILYVLVSRFCTLWVPLVYVVPLMCATYACAAGATCVCGATYVCHLCMLSYELCVLRDDQTGSL